MPSTGHASFVLDGLESLAEASYLAIIFINVAMGHFADD